MQRVTLLSLCLFANVAFAADSTLKSAAGGGVGAAAGTAIGQVVGGKTGGIIGGAVGGGVGAAATTDGSGKTGAVVGGAVGGAAGAAVGQSAGGKTGGIIGAGVGGAAGAAVGKSATENEPARTSKPAAGGTVAAVPVRTGSARTYTGDDEGRHHRKGHAYGHYKNRNNPGHRHHHDD